MKFISIGNTADSQIIFTSNVQQPVVLYLFDPQGKLIYKETHALTQGISRYKLKRRPSAGLYLLRAENRSGQTRVLRIMVKE
jgi:hypothetical protein